ncbi:hypothetical protein RINTHM_8220 [Richelia intracellularis HM01]|uniref:hypothetical protein n=1 Tax=Richelia intracellularis TaxID=1164990 RepID=UPI0002B52CA0|nr:hypothetical protein [Richelia intracellularis]CCH65285.1 hypothetical protein RINTHM_8220 [Richelia intracellularis HM01]
MESLHNQILSLNTKIDAVYQVIEKLDRKFSHALADSSLVDKVEITDIPGNNMKIERPHFRASLNLHPEMGHKDILLDGMSPESNIQLGEQQITQEIQMQRLTAQLTAAYNRIAALEEQLLLKRISS